MAQTTDTETSTAPDVGINNENERNELTNTASRTTTIDGQAERELQSHDQSNSDIEGQAQQREQEPPREKDPNLVTFDEPYDPLNPKCWTNRKRWTATLAVSMFTFISPITSSMVAPALPEMAAELNVTSSSLQNMILSIYVLAYAIGPLFLGPTSEIVGRAPVLQITNLLFIAFNLGCGFAKTGTQMIVFRFFAGLGGCAPLAVGGGVLSDLWPPEKRGKALSIYTAGPLLGPALGPVAGGWIAERTTWRWVFWSTTIYNGFVQLFALWVLRETYAPKILQRKAEALRKETGNMALHTAFEENSEHTSILKKLEVALQRPFKLLGTQPVVQVVSLYMAFIYGVTYLVLTTFALIWFDYYNESPGIGGLNYISLGLGFIIGTQICAPLNDRIYVRLKTRNNGVGRPEFRLPMFVISIFLIPIGIFIYGWTAEFHTHWIAPNIGTCIFTAGTMIAMQCLQTYVIDTYTRYAASAMSAVNTLRSLCGFVFPLFATQMYKALGLGWGNSLLGFLSIAIGWPVPLLLWKYGPRLRAKSPFAAG